MLIILLSLLGFAAVQRPSDVVRWSATPPSEPVIAGRVATIELTARIEEGWKLYALSQPKGGPLPLAIALPRSAPFTLRQKQISGPVPKLLKDEIFNLETQYYEHEATFTVPVDVPKRLTGKQQVPIDVTFQACGANICLRPFTQRMRVDIVVSR